MARLTSFAGRTGPVAYAIAAPLLLVPQYLIVMLAYRSAGLPLVPDLGFWLLPMRRLAMMPGLTTVMAASVFAISLVIAWALALLSFRRANWSGMGYIPAALSIAPGLQIAAIAALAVLPRLTPPEHADPLPETNVPHVIQGLLAGVAIIVVAVLVSALTFGAYGWGLFVMTPLLVGITTGYLVNRRHLLSSGRTTMVVLTAAALGTVALVMLALEGIFCVLLAAPLGAVVVIIGGAIGRAIARAKNSRDMPLLSIALLPALFALEAAIPPAIPITSHATIDIAAPPTDVWQALIDSAPIAGDPGLVRLTGLAYPVRSRLIGGGAGAIRLGQFSTGVAREQVTEWVPGRRLSFVVVRQPPAMEEMSPYRRVHAPHVIGYFETGETRFDLAPVAGGHTRLTVGAVHRLRIDPALYWEPLARMAIRLNETRVLRDVRGKAEQRRSADRAVARGLATAAAVGRSAPIPAPSGS